MNVWRNNHPLYGYFMLIVSSINSVHPNIYKHTHILPTLCLIYYSFYLVSGYFFRFYICFNIYLIYGSIQLVNYIEMDKFLRKRKHEASSSEDEDRIIDGEIAAEDISICPLPVDNSQPPDKSKKNRMYMDSYLVMGFTWCGDDLTPNPECLVCGEKLSNEAMVPSKLKRHFLSKHSQLSEKHLEYFQRLLIGHEQQMLSFAKKVKVSSKASYLVAELIAKQMKPHTFR